MFTKITFRNVVFVVLCVIFTLYAIDVITINPKLIPLLLIVSIYLLTCKNWNIFSKENREEFSEDEKGTLVIPGNLKVAGKLIVDDSIQTKDLKVTSIYSNTTHHPDVNIQNKVNMNKDVKIDGNARIAKQIDTKSIYVTGLSNSGSLNVRGDTTIGGMTKCHNITASGHVKVPSLNCEGKLKLEADTALEGNKNYGLIVSGPKGGGILASEYVCQGGHNYLTKNGTVTTSCHVHDGINTGTLNVRGDSAFNGHLTIANGKNIYHKNNSKSIYGHGEAKIDPNDGAIGFHSGWYGNGLHIVGIKNGNEGRVIRLHANDTRFDKLSHHTGDGKIYRTGGQFTLEGDDIIDLRSMVRILPKNYSTSPPRDTVQIFSHKDHYWYFNNEANHGYYKYK